MGIANQGNHPMSLAAPVGPSTRPHVVPPLQMPSASNAQDRAVVEFCARWRLDTEAQNLLRNQYQAAPEVAEKIMQLFSPRDTSRDANGIFLRFANSVIASPRQQHMDTNVSPSVQRPIEDTIYAQAAPVVVPPPQATPSWLDPSNVNDAAVNDFCAKWQLQSEAQNLLTSQLHSSPEVAERIMQQFSPRDTSRDSNGIFLRFAKSIIASPRQPEVPNTRVAPTWDNLLPSGDILAFCTRWSLGDDAQSLLFSLDAEKQRRVMAEFLPRDASSDVNHLFLKFAQGVLKGTAGKGKGKTPAHVVEQTAVNTLGAYGGYYGAAPFYPVYYGTHYAPY